MNPYERLFKAASRSVPLTLLGACGASFSAVRQGVATESAPAEKPLLRDFPYSGYALRQVIPLEKLPPRIAFKKGEVSLSGGSLSVNTKWIAKPCPLESASWIH